MSTYRVLVADKIAREGLAPLADDPRFELVERPGLKLSLIHISEPTRPY